MSDRKATRPERVTFSITGYSDDVIGELHSAAKRMDVSISSVFRFNLGMYERLLQNEWITFSRNKCERINKIAEILQPLHMCHREVMPELDSLIPFVEKYGNVDLVKTIREATFLELCIIMHKIRMHKDEGNKEHKGQKSA